MPRDMRAETELLIESAEPAIGTVPLSPAQQFERATTLAEVLRLALDDFEAVLDDPRYVIDFRNWHRPIHPAWSAEWRGLIGKKGAVCLGGSVIARRLGADINGYFSPESFEDACDQLWAINYLRAGHIYAAAICLYGGAMMTRLPHSSAMAEGLTKYWMPILRPFAGSITLDEVDGWWFAACMRGMQADLAEAGL